jgi:hypothetical protein
MAENTVTVDLDRLRLLADRVDRTANALGKFTFRGIDPSAMIGSEVVGVAGPERIAARFEDVLAGMRSWAAAARQSVDTLGAAELGAADRITGS